VRGMQRHSRSRRLQRRSPMSQLPRHRTGPHSAGILFDIDDLRAMPWRGNDHLGPVPQVPGTGPNPQE
jgi:muconolactone delta-isomerase